MIHQVAQAIATALRHRAAGRSDAADQALDAAARSTLGLSMGVLRSLDLGTLQSLLSDGRGPDVRRQVVAARLLQTSENPGDRERAAALIESLLRALADAGLTRSDLESALEAAEQSWDAIRGAEEL